MSSHMAASLALEAYRTRLGAVLSFIDDAAAARIQLPTDPEELTATLDGLLEYFLAGEAAFTASGSELAQHSKRVQSLRAALDALEREERDTALLIHQLHACSATADASIAAAMDTSDALRAAAASGTCPVCCSVCNLWLSVPSLIDVGHSALAEARKPRIRLSLTAPSSHTMCSAVRSWVNAARLGASLLHHASTLSRLERREPAPFLPAAAHRAGGTGVAHIRAARCVASRLPCPCTFRY